MAGIQYESYTVYDIPSSSCVVNKPSGTADGDLLVFLTGCEYGTGSGTPITYSDFTPDWRGDYINYSTYNITYWAYHICGSSEPSTYSMTVPPINGSGIGGITVLRFSHTSGNWTEPSLSSQWAGYVGNASYSYINTVTPQNGDCLIGFQNRDYQHLRSFTADSIYTLGKIHTTDHGTACTDVMVGENMDGSATGQISHYWPTVTGRMQAHHLTVTDDAPPATGGPRNSLGHVLKGPFGGPIG